MPKTGLKTRDVSPDHFSSGRTVAPDYSRFVIRLLEGKYLLASDIETGKSDPVCFVWCGGRDEKQPDWPNVTELNAEENRVVLTEVCPTTIDPKWNQDLTFPLEVTDISLLESMKCVILVRDEDRDEHDIASYDELGMIEFNFEDIIKDGRGLQNSVVKPAAWYNLSQSPGMRKKAEGSIKLTISIIFAANDLPVITEQLKHESDGNRSVNIGQMLQKKLKSNKLDNSVVSKGSVISLSNTNNGRPLSASGRDRKKKTQNLRPKTAPMLKTGSLMSTTSSAVFEDSDEILIKGDPSKDDFNNNELSVVKEEDGDDLVSEPGYDKLISQIEKHGKKMAEVSSRDAIPEELEEVHEDNHPENSPEVVQPIRKPENPFATEKKDTAKSESLKSSEPINARIDNTNTRATINADSNTNSNPNNNTKPASNAKDDSNPVMEDHVEEQKFEHELPLGDESILEELARIGIEAISNSVNNFELPDGFQEHCMQAGKAIASAAKRGVLSSKMKIMGPSSLTGANSGVLRDSLVLDIQELQNRFNALDQVEGKGKSEEGRNAAANVFANGPSGGDNLENILPDESKDVYRDPPVVEQRKQHQRQQPELISSDPSNQSLVRSVSRSQFVSQYPLEDPIPESGEIATIPQGNATAVVRVLKELHAQRQFMQNSVILIAKANEKGFKHLSGRISKLEKNLTTLEQSMQFTRNRNHGEDGDDFAFRLEDGDQALPDEEPPKYSIGQRVEVNYRGKGKYFVGVVSNMNEDRTYEIEFDDGDRAKNVNEDLIRSSGAGGEGRDEGEEERQTSKQFSKTAPWKKSQLGKKSDSLNKTTPLPPKKKDYTGFKEFRKQARRQRTTGAYNSDNPEDYVITEKKTRDPPMEFVFKDEKGGVAAAPIAGPAQPLSPGNRNNDNYLSASKGGEDLLLAGPIVGDQALPDSPKLPGRDYRHREQPRPPRAGAVSHSFSRNYAATPSSPSKSVLNKDFCDVLDRGTINDVANLLESSGAQPDQLSISTRNRLYDVISTLLFQGRNVERSLVWVLALTRGKQKLMSELTAHTQKDLLESLKRVSKEPSKRGMLATLLISQINRQISN